MCNVRTTSSSTSVRLLGLTPWQEPGENPYKRARDCIGEDAFVPYARRSAAQVSFLTHGCGQSPQFYEQNQRTVRVRQAALTKWISTVSTNSEEQAAKEGSSAAVPVAHDAVWIIVEEQIPSPLAFLLDCMVHGVCHPVVGRDNSFQIL